MDQRTMFDVALPFSRGAGRNQRRRRRTIIGCYYTAADSDASRPESESGEPAQDYQQEKPTANDGIIHPAEIAA